MTRARDIADRNVDSTTIDGVDSTQLLRSDVADTKTAGDLSFADNVKAVFGAGSDLQIYHDGTNSRIVDSGTGNVVINSSNALVLRTDDNLETYAIFTANGSADLYYDNSKKFATTSTGIDVTGTITADNLTMSDSSTPQITLTDTTNSVTGVVFADNGEMELGTTSNHAVAVKTNNTERLRITNGGNVGIGTTSPAAKVDIKSTGATSTALRVLKSSAGQNLHALTEISGHGRLSVYDGSENEDIRLDSNGASYFNGGNVGISRTNPSYKLHISTTATNGTAVTGLSITNNASNSGVGAKINLGAGNGFDSTSGGISGFFDGTGTALAFLTSSNYGVSNQTESMRITSGGNVGIGTSSPSYPLTIENSANHLYLKQSNEDNGWLINTADADGKLHFYRRGEGASPSNNERLTISTGGAVGIGTTSPSYKLDVDVGAPSSSDQVLGRFSSEAGTRSIGYVWDDSASTLGIATLTNHAIAFHINGNSNEKMRIDSSGNVGIGVTNPSSFYSGSDTLVVNGGMTIYSTSTSRLEFADGTSGSQAYVGNIVYDHTGNFMRFATNVSEAMRIDSSGNLHIGKTANDLGTAGLSLRGGNDVAQFTRSENPPLELSRLTSDGEIAGFYRDTTKKGSISVASGGTTYNTTSDRRLKTDIQPIADATDKLMQMQPVTHKWIADPDGDAVHGFIAQDMQKIVPEAVSGEDGGEEMMSMDYGRITPVLVAALQDAHRKIEELEQRLSEMEN